MFPNELWTIIMNYLPNTDIVTIMSILNKSIRNHVYIEHVPLRVFEECPKISISCTSMQKIENSQSWIQKRLRNCTFSCSVRNLENMVRHQQFNEVLWMEYCSKISDWNEMHQSMLYGAIEGLCKIGSLHGSVVVLELVKQTKELWGKNEELQTKMRDAVRKLVWFGYSHQDHETNRLAELYRHEVVLMQRMQFPPLFPRHLDARMKVQIRFIKFCLSILLDSEVVDFDANLKVKMFSQKHEDVSPGTIERIRMSGYLHHRPQSQCLRQIPSIWAAWQWVLLQCTRTKTRKKILELNESIVGMKDFQKETMLLLTEV